MVKHQIQESLTRAGDVALVSITGAMMMEWLPPLTALLTLVWTIIRLYETKTVQNLFKKRKNAKK